MGIAPEDDAIWARLMNALVSADDPEQNPEGPETVMERDVPEIIAALPEAHRRRASRTRPTT